MPLAKLSANLAGATRQIADVMRDWHVAECSDLFRDMSARAMGAEFTGSAALLGDAVRGVAVRAAEWQVPAQPVDELSEGTAVVVRRLVRDEGT